MVLGGVVLRGDGLKPVTDSIAPAGDNPADIESAKPVGAEEVLCDAEGGGVGDLRAAFD